ncbi:hypothetical protein [Halanaerobacter jeridensis]|uniref:Flagellar assembly protein T N-terminal domain-containing protein n=1 Tax=Halanaerobacter jeridensis TaxID=706427 RepID=A0A938XVD4_9FIRM|nr:hypothetical protein [Halanaerobacter jeridensis]MBM7557539.1 hypothetical protein [Halanaerobacter jeridensis]
MKGYYRRGIILFILLLLFSLSSITTAADTKTVVVQGLASLEDSSLAVAKEKAVNRGLRRAVEQVVGTYIDATTKVENGQLISDRILKDSRGYVKDYQILKENVVDNNYQVQLRVAVGTGDVINDLEALELNIKQQGNPRVMILIEQMKEGYYVNLSPQVVNNKLMEEFIASGYRVLDQEQIKKVVDSEQRQAMIAGNYCLAAKLGSQLQADLVVLGDARASHVDLSDVYGDNLSSLESYSSNINVKVINITTAEVITTANAEASGAGANKESAARKALTKAANDLGQELIDDLSKELIQAEKTVTVKVNNLQSLAELKELESVLNTMRSIKRVYLRGYNNNLGTFDIELKQRTKVLDVALELEKNLGFEFEINNLSSAKLVLRIQ